MGLYASSCLGCGNKFIWFSGAVEQLCTDCINNTKKENGVVLKFKRVHPDAIIPVKATVGSVGWDLTAVDDSFIENSNKLLCVQYDTGIALEIPEGYYVQLVARSSISNTGCWMANSLGIVDQDFRGTLKFRFYVSDRGATPYMIGDRVGQMLLLPIPKATLQEVKELDVTSRGSGEFGSTGN